MVPMTFNQQELILFKLTIFFASLFTKIEATNSNGFLIQQGRLRLVFDHIAVALELRRDSGLLVGEEF